MQKILFGVFAHPDDEAFCVAATLLQETTNGTELHLISLTDGNGRHSQNPDDNPDLGAARLEEWLTAGKLIGAVNQHLLGYTDGELGNDDHLEIVRQLERFITDTVAGRQDIEIELITFDLDGLTGHIDHIVASRSALMVYYKLKTAGLAVKRIRLACLQKSDFPTVNTAFALWQPGREPNEIDETVDLRDRIDHIKQIMYAHRSQRQDADFWIKTLGDRVAVNHFIVIS